MMVSIGIGVAGLALTIIFGILRYAFPSVCRLVARAVLAVGILLLITSAILIIKGTHQNIPDSASGQGGKGGGGNAVGKGSRVIGGNGGPGGSPGAGRGGDGGGGDAVGEGATVMGGDGGGGGRFDGRGGAGAKSTLSKVPPETLRAFGLTGKETYGQGGNGANSPEYDRMLRVVTALSLEFKAANSSSQLTTLPGLSMAPVDWINERLAQSNESFRVELADFGHDFLFRKAR